MYIPEILRRHRIMGRNRIELCECGHYHKETKHCFTIFIPDYVIKYVEFCKKYEEEFQKYEEND